MHHFQYEIIVLFFAHPFPNGDNRILFHTPVTRVFEFISSFEFKIYLIYAVFQSHDTQTRIV